ncbi:MAG: hypothetical protein OQK50_05325 [Deltaproteobacteria bacterium]|nr:hypothetical protein [Deltaproteobacteria bacterium]
MSIHFDNKRTALEEFDTLMPQRWRELQNLFQQVRPPEYFADLFGRIGAPFSLAAFDLTRDEFMLAGLNSRTIRRERITVLDFAAHAGVLEARQRRMLSNFSTDSAFVLQQAVSQKQQ